MKNSAHSRRFAVAARVLWGVGFLLFLIGELKGSDNWDMRFVPPPDVDGRIWAMAVSGTDVYVGGEFTRIGGKAASNIAKWNGTSWEPLGDGAEGPIYALAVSGTNLYAGGSFATVDGTSAANIALWNGTTWSDIGGGISSDSGDAAVQAIAISGTNVYAGGSFNTAGTTNATNIARWNGSTWSALGKGIQYVTTNVDDTTAAVVTTLAASNNVVFVGGIFNAAGNTSTTNIARWSGTAWSTLGGGLDYIPDSSDDTTTGSVLNLTFNGTNLYAGGVFNNAAGKDVENLARWSGTNWIAVGGPVQGAVESIITNGTDIYIGGAFSTVDSVSANNVAHWNGSFWEALDTGIENGDIAAMALLGKELFVGGTFDTAGGSSVLNIAKWNFIHWSGLTSGAGNSPVGPVYSILINGTNTYVGGDFNHVATIAANNIANWTGNNWQPLGAGLDGPVVALANYNGIIIAGGGFTNSGDTVVSNIASWNGTAWQSLGTGFDDVVYALLASGTNLYAGGQFTTAGGLAINSIAKWNGSSWEALGTGMDGPVYALASDGTNLFAGGAFTNAGGVLTPSLAMWNGTEWNAMGAGADGPVYSLLFTNAVLYAGGTFATVGGIDATNLASWNGTTWSQFGGGTDGTVDAMTFRDSNLVVSGSFSMAGTNSSSAIAEWNGSTWIPLGNGLDDSGYALAVSGTDIFVGGAFANAGEESSFHFGIWHDGSPFFTQQPDSYIQLAASSDLALTASISGTPPISYQWYFNGAAISGAATTTYTRTNIQASDTGLYFVMASNVSGVITSDVSTVLLDGATVFFDNFDSGAITNWTTATGGSALATTTNKSHSGSYSALCDTSSDLMYHNLGTEVQGHARLSFWAFDNNGTQTKWFGQMRAYTGTGFGSGTEQQSLAIGRYSASFGTNNTGDFQGETVVTANYQGQIFAGGSTGTFNLTDATNPNRSNGWHLFQVERWDDGGTVDFLVDGEISRESFDTKYATFDSVLIGSIGSGTTSGNVWFDDVKVEYLDPPTILKNPADVIIKAGASATFSASATNNVRSYQWRHNGIAISGATTNSLTVTNVQSASAGGYDVVVGNGVGPTVSSSATLTLAVPPTITTPPLSQTVAAGTDLQLMVLASGAPDSFTYQWRKNGANIAGANQSELILLDAQSTNAASYSVVVSNIAGSITSAVAIVTITNAGPVITSQPQSQTVNLGANVTFGVHATGTDPKTYQWRFNGTNIANATLQSYRKTTLQSNDVGNYSVAISNAQGVVVSSTATLTLNFPPVVTTQPQGLTVFSGADVTFTVSATGTVPLSYQWRKDGNNIADATDATLMLSNVESADTGNYSVKVFNIAGSTVSSNANLVVNGPPSILEQPSSVTVSAGTNATFSVTAVGSGTLSYQWHLNGSNLAAATSSSLTITNVQSTKVGLYSVTITNPYGSTNSDDASLQLDGFVVFFDDFESGTLTNWTAFTNTTSLAISKAQQHSTTNSALGTNSLEKMYHNLGMEVEGHRTVTFWIYDDGGTQTVWFGEARGYAGAFSTAPQQLLAIGRYDYAFPTNQTGDLGGGLMDTNYYQAYVANGANTGYVNLSDGPTRSTGWHEFIIEMMDDETTVNFYVDGNAAQTVYDSIPMQWDQVTIGSSGTNGVTGNVWFDDVKVAYLDPPLILADPVDQGVNTNDAAVFTVEATGNVTSYQWRFNDVNIAGATTSSLTISNAQASNEGFYSVVVMNGVGATISADAALTLNQSPSIIEQPTNTAVAQGATALLTVVADGTGPLSYQWFFNGAAITGGTDDTLIVSNAQPANAGAYRVEIDNMAGSVTSAVATLNVIVPQPAQFTSAFVTSNQIHFVLSGNVSSTYAIQVSTNLINWTNYTSVVLSNGTYEVIDALTNRLMFYRTEKTQ